MQHLNACGVDTTQLLFEDALDLEDYAKRGALELFLVDHNRLASKQAHWERFVVDVIDHHKDELGFANAKAKRILFPLGSCCTLVGALIVETMCLNLDRDLARLLLGVVLVDTGNFDPVLGKTESLDHAMRISLANMAGMDEVSQTALWEKLNAAKFDVALLSTYNLLRKDYTEFVTIGGVQLGISAVLDSLLCLDRRGDLASSVDSWMARRNLHILIVVAAYNDVEKTFRRQLLVCFRPDHQTMGLALTQYLAAQSSLQLSTLSVPEPGTQLPLCFRLFAQGNVASSRNQLQPLVESFFATQ